MLALALATIVAASAPSRPSDLDVYRAVLMYIQRELISANPGPDPGRLGLCFEVFRACGRMRLADRDLPLSKSCPATIADSVVKSLSGAFLLVRPAKKCRASGVPGHPEPLDGLPTSWMSLSVPVWTDEQRATVEMPSHGRVCSITVESDRNITVRCEQVMLF